MRERAQRITSGAGLLAVALAMTCAAGAQEIPQQGVPTAPGTERPVTTSARPEGQVSSQARHKGIAIRSKLDPQDRDLTFLPELTPTDGVPDLAEQKNGEAKVASEAAAMHEQPMLMDRAVAVIDAEVILESDVREQQHFAVFEPYSVPGGEFTPVQAMQQVVNRTLLLQQMAEQQLVAPPTDEAVNRQIDDLRKHLPACAGQHCETAAGWQHFLAAHGFSEGQLHTRWKERMQILSFIGVRFRTGIRIAKPEIETYYKEKLVPEFAARKLPPPPLTTVSDRVEEVLLQQHVNVLLNDYLRSLKDAGSIQILDPKYNDLGKTATASSGGAVAAPGRTGGEQ